MLSIKIETTNAAFCDDVSDKFNRFTARREIQKITGAIAAKIEDGEVSGTCRDSNGNTVGTWSLS